VPNVPSSQGQAPKVRPGGARRELRVSLRRAAELGPFRRDLRAVLAPLPLSEPDREAIVLAASEAVDNALLACQQRACSVEVAVSLVSGYVCVENRDAGEGFKGACFDRAKLAHETDEHGRGLHLMDALMESLELVPRSQGTMLRMTKRLGECTGQASEMGPRRVAC
jgi:anti-sigma regulatory factor (Ser/Thr protein kinase)